MILEKIINKINEIIPNNNTNIYNQIDILIKKYKEEMNNMSNTISKEELLKMIEIKYNDLINNIKIPLEEYLNDIKKDNLKTSITQEIINTKISEYINKFNNSYDKGLLSENKLNYIMNNLYKTGEIINTSKDNHKCDLLLRRQDKKDILIENKDYKDNVPKCEINKFLSDLINYNKTHHESVNGLLISQNSGIANKNNYQIEIDNNNIILYIHNCCYDQEKIKLGIEIIDHLSIILKDINKTTNNTYNISNETLHEINNEYLNFMNRRQTLKSFINDSTKKMIDQLMDIELPNLSNILKTKYTTITTDDLVCKKCKNYIGKNKKALSVHYRSCKVITTPSSSSSEKEE